MAEMKIERKPGEQRLKDLGIEDWPIWTKEESEFPWPYDESETCYFLKELLVEPNDCGFWQQLSSTERFYANAHRHPCPSV